MSAPASAAGSRLRTLDLTYTALFAVLMAVCAWISIPVPKPMVPFSMQTFAVFAALAVLGGRRGTYAVSAYLLLGAAGLPVFTGFRGGLSVLLGSTGGYLIGFMGTALVFWLMEKLLGNSLPVKTAACLVGMAVYYVFGTAWFLVVYTRDVGPVGLGGALASCVIPFIIPDLAKLALALLLSRRLSKFLK